MKLINEQKLNEVLEYIKTFQRQNGISPSFRQIQKALNFSALSVAQRYVYVLKQRGLLEQNSAGQIAIPQNLRKGETILAPLVGTIACGNPIEAEQNIEETYQLPVALFGSQELIGLTALGNSMTGVGIFNGDKVFYLPCNSAENGDIIVALIDNSATIKRYEKKGSYAILHPENPDYKDIITRDLKIQGIVKKVVHSI